MSLKSIFGSVLTICIFVFLAFAQEPFPSVQNYEFPSYPPAARALQAEGLVLIFVEVSKAGKILNATAIGHPLLRAVSEAAARSWKFSPNLYESYLTLRFVFNSHPGRYDSGQKIVTGPYGIQITAERVLLDF